MTEANTLDWQVVVVLELDRRLTEPEVVSLEADSPKNASFSVPDDDAARAASLGMTSRERAPVTMEAVTSAVRDMERHLAKLPKGPRPVRVCHWLATRLHAPRVA